MPTAQIIKNERESGNMLNAPVEVLRVRGRIVVVGESSGAGFDIDEPHHFPAPAGAHQ